MNNQDWSPLGWTGWISLQSKGLARVFSNTTVQKHQAFLMVHLSHPYTTTSKTISLTRGTFVNKVMSLFFNMLSRLVKVFLPRNKRLLISWLQFICSDFGAQENKVSLVPLFPHLFAMKVMGLDAIMIHIPHFLSFFFFFFKGEFLW